MTDISKDFSTEAAAPALMAPEAYRAVLERLLGEGQGYGKTKNVGGFLLPDIRIVTETSSGQNETAKNIAVEKFYLTLDTDQYPSEYLRKLVVKDVAKNWGEKTVRERDWESADFRGPGIWTLKKGAFEGDYMPADPDNAQSTTWKPNPEAHRVTLTTDETVIIPVQWGTFKIEAGGTLAIRQKDVAALAEALADIRAGTKTTADALYATDKEGKTVSKFDIYGMEPGFLEKNYDPVTLKAETQAVAAQFAPAAPKRPAANGNRPD
jgi:hypothetical protein